MIRSLAIVASLLLLQADAAVSKQQQPFPCEPRKFSFDSFVCVCNSTYCDSFANAEVTTTTSLGIVTTYQSDQAVNRFALGQLKFNKNSVNSSDGGVTITLNRTQTFQSLIGFGAAFTDSAGLNIEQLPEALGRNIIKDYYGPNGLRYTMGRVPIGGSDFSMRAYTYDDVDQEDFDLLNWKLQSEDFQYKIPLIRQALQEAPTKLKLFASPWSAPAWMKTNNNLTGKGELKGDPTGIYYNTWANYIVKFLDEYKKYDITFWGLTVQNEPSDGTIEDFPFNALGMTDEQQRDFVFQTLGPKLNASGYGKDSLKLMIFDDQRLMIQQWADTILSQEEAKQFIAGMAFHWYMNTVSFPEMLDQVHEKYPDFFLISTEACEGSLPNEQYKVALGDWTRAESYAYDIINDLQHHTSAWIDWNLALDTDGGPNWVSNLVDAPIVVNSTSGEYYKQPMYYALGHFTRFLEPGSTRLGIVQDSTDLDVVVFTTPTKSTVAVIMNRLNEDVPLQINDPEYGAIQTTIESHSIKTFVW